MIDGLSDPIAYGLGVLLFGGWIGLAGVVRLLFAGKLATSREIEEKNRELDTVKATNAELLGQNGALIRSGEAGARSSEASARLMDTLRAKLDREAS
jgi:hypothetical protein